MRFPITHRMKLEGYPDWPFRRAAEREEPPSKGRESKARAA